MGLLGVGFRMHLKRKSDDVQFRQHIDYWSLCWHQYTFSYHSLSWLLHFRLHTSMPVRVLDVCPQLGRRCFCIWGLSPTVLSVVYTALCIAAKRCKIRNVGSMYFDWYHFRPPRSTLTRKRGGGWIIPTPNTLISKTADLKTPHSNYDHMVADGGNTLIW